MNDNDTLHDEAAENADNDYLAAYLAGMISADRVVFLTDQSGVYGIGEDGKADIIKTVEQDSSLLEQPPVRVCQDNGNILDKIATSSLLSDLGIDTVICDGRDSGTVSRALSGYETGTFIRAAKRKRLTGTRKWLATGAMPKGTLVLSRLGAEVLSRPEQRGSLLAKGIEEISGRFEKGDVVSVCDREGKLLGYGITRYAFDELPILMGQDDIVVVHANYFYGVSLEWYLNAAIYHSKSAGTRS